MSQGLRWELVRRLRLLPSQFPPVGEVFYNLETVNG
jgi:hypothetical protein